MLKEEMKNKESQWYIIRLFSCCGSVGEECRWLLVSKQSPLYSVPWSTFAFAANHSVISWFKQPSSNTICWRYLKQCSTRLFQSESELQRNFQFQWEILYWLSCSLFPEKQLTPTSTTATKEACGAGAST